MSQLTLYAWAVPAFVSGSPVDHTWVTTYDNRAVLYPDDQTVSNSGEYYWYCWGSFHAKGGLLGLQTGNLNYASCLVQPNADSQQVSLARGTIFTYGVDGVCHQLTNQVLYATGSGVSSPLTVNNARGYHASTFIYGTYGLQHSAWGNKQNSCSASLAAYTFPLGGEISMSALNDEFEQHVKDALGPDNDELVKQLLIIRDSAHAQRSDILMLQNDVPVTAETLNDRNQLIFNKAAKLLGNDLFIKVFGFSPTENINLVDPEIMKKTNS